MADDSMSPGEMVIQWAETNAQWVAGTRFVPEVHLLPANSSTPEGWWGKGLPEGLSVAPDMIALLSAIRLGGYLAYDEVALQTLGADLGSPRALMLADGANLDVRQRTLVATRVGEGATLLAFGHASLLGDEYALADVFGASYGGLVQFDTEASRVKVTADTTYAPQFSPPNVIDGRAETFWASIEAGPMPHWVQLDFERPRTAGGAQVSCRPGFLLKDFEVQASVGEDWKTLANVSDNKEWVIECPFSQPTEAQSFRLFITREELNSENRVIADVGEFTLLDERGARLIAPPYLIEGCITDKAWTQANRSDRLVMRSPAIRVKPGTARVLATFPDPLTSEPLPLCTVNRFGKGRAYLFAVPETAFGYAPETWEALFRAFVGMPTVRHSGDENVVAFLRRGKDRAVLHVVDTAPVGNPERAREVIVRADAKVLGRVKAVRLLPDQTPIETRLRGGWVQFTMPLEPMGTVLLELAR